MSNDSTSDQGAFQRLLESAFAVQESGISLQSLSGTVEIQRSLVANQLTLGTAMQRIAEQARAVANASGIAIGLLEGDGLVYRAGSGTGASYTGRHVMATLTLPARNKAKAEILRVEDASSDNRIEAAICQQFEANSLLMLPIYSDRSAKGVLQVFFKQAHSFHEQEVAIYRLLAGLVGEALSRAANDKETQAAHGQALVAETGGTSLSVTSPSLGSIHNAAEADVAICKTCGAPLAECERELPEPVPDPSILNGERIANFVSQRSVWVQALAAAAMLAVIGWGVHSERGRQGIAARSQLSPSLKRQASTGSVRESVGTQEATPSSRFAQTDLSVQPAALREPIQDYGSQRTASAVIVRHTGPTVSTITTSAAKSDTQARVKHFGSDVTVHYFSPKFSTPQGSQGGTEVRRLSDDVTVRYFKQKSSEHQSVEVSGRPSTSR